MGVERFAVGPGEHQAVAVLDTGRGVFGGLAVSLIFGTFASTVLTLVVIPLMYYLWERRQSAAQNA